MPDGKGAVFSRAGSHEAATIRRSEGDRTALRATLGTRLIIANKLPTLVMPLRLPRKREFHWRQSVAIPSEQVAQRIDHRTGRVARVHPQVETLGKSITAVDDHPLEEPAGTVIGPRKGAPERCLPKFGTPLGFGLVELLDGRAAWWLRRLQCPRSRLRPRGSPGQAALPAVLT